MLHWSRLELATSYSSMNFYVFRKFADILCDTVQLLWLKRFLSDHGAITPLKFWQDVERMKTQSKDSRARQTKARVIVKQYFANTDDPSKKFLVLLVLMQLMRKSTIYTSRSTLSDPINHELQVF